MTFEEMRVYMTRSEGNCWVGVSMADGNMAMISRFGEEQEFICDYDGASLGDEIETDDIDKALRWLWNRKASKGGMSFLVFRRRLKVSVRWGSGHAAVAEL